MKGFSVLPLILAFDLSYASVSQILYTFAIHKNIQNLLIFTCAQFPNDLHLLKFLNRKNIFANFQEINDSAVIESKIFKTSFSKLGVVVSHKCNNYGDVFKSDVRRNIFDENYFWLIIGDDVNSEYNFNVLSESKIDINSEVTYVDEITGDVFEIYNSGKLTKGVLKILPIGKWSKTGFMIEDKRYKYIRRINMTGTVLKSAIVVTKKDLKVKYKDYLEEQKETHIDSMHRYHYALLLHLRDIYNFSYDMIRTSSWGYPTQNGSFDGMIGQLQKKLIDIGGSPAFPKLERLKAADFAIEIWASRQCFVFRHPKRGNSVYKIYSRPLEDNVWYCIVLTLILFFLLLLILRRPQKKIKHESGENEISTILLLTAGALFQQGLPFDTHLSSMRFVIFNLFIFTILIYQFYSASIVSSLLLEPPKTIRTPQNLLDSNLKAGTEYVLYILDYFKRTEDQVARSLFTEKMVTTKGTNIYNAAEGLALVKKGGFAFYGDISSMYKIITDTFEERQICDLSEIQLTPQRFMVSMVQKGSPYKKLVTYGLRKISLAGLTTRQRIIWHERKPHCSHSIDPSRITMNIKEFSPALSFLLAGGLASLVILSMEMVYDKLTKDRK